MATGLALDSISKRFDSTEALADVSFDVAVGEVVGLLGPSGSGKSTLLAVIAGIEAPDAGRVLWDGQDLASVPPHRRGFGMVFQDYALFPHLNVFDNVAFGLRARHQSPAAVRTAVAEALARVGLAGFERRDVHSLSGGEAQRVALARALAPGPRLLMLDEPLGALDRTLRERLMVELPRLLRQLGLTAVYVTHDQEEAFAVSDRVVLLQAGHVAQIGRPAEVYAAPTSEFVARFLGLTNLLSGTVEGVTPLRVRTALGVLNAVAADGALAPGAAVQVLIRPEVSTSSPTAANQLEGVVLEARSRGSRVRTRLDVAGVELSLDIAADVALPVAGQRLRFGLPATSVQVIRWNESPSTS